MEKVLAFMHARSTDGPLASINTEDEDAMFMQMDAPGVKGDIVACGEVLVGFTRRTHAWRNTPSAKSLTELEKQAVHAPFNNPFPAMVDGVAFDTASCVTSCPKHYFGSKKQASVLSRVGAKLTTALLTFCPMHPFSQDIIVDELDSIPLPTRAFDPSKFDHNDPRYYGSSVATDVSLMSLVKNFVMIQVNMDIADDADRTIFKTYKTMCPAKLLRLVCRRRKVIARYGMNLAPLGDYNTNDFYLCDPTVSLIRHADDPLAVPILLPDGRVAIKLLRNADVGDEVTITRSDVVTSGGNDPTRNTLPAELFPPVDMQSGQRAKGANEKNIPWLYAPIMVCDGIHVIAHKLDKTLRTSSSYTFQEAFAVFNEFHLLLATLKRSEKSYIVYDLQFFRRVVAYLAYFSGSVLAAAPSPIDPTVSLAVEKMLGDVGSMKKIPLDAYKRLRDKSGSNKSVPSIVAIVFAVTATELVFNSTHRAFIGSCVRVKMKAASPNDMWFHHEIARDLANQAALLYSIHARSDFCTRRSRETAATCQTLFSKAREIYYGGTKNASRFHIPISRCVLGIGDCLVAMRDDIDTVD